MSFFRNIKMIIFRLRHNATVKDDKTTNLMFVLAPFGLCINKQLKHRNDAKLSSFVQFENEMVSYRALQLNKEQLSMFYTVFSYF